MRKTTIIGLGAAALALIATFMPIIAGNSGNFWSESDASNEAQNIRIVALIMISSIAVFSFLSNKKHKFAIGNLIASLLLFGSISLVLIGANLDKDYDAGSGLYLILMSSILGIISSILGFMKK